jgi:hypothetical protein
MGKVPTRKQEQEDWDFEGSAARYHQEACGGPKHFIPSAESVQGGIQMTSRIWIVMAAVALVALAAIGVKKQRERAEAERMTVWG